MKKQQFNNKSVKNHRLQSVVYAFTKVINVFQYQAKKQLIF
nr:MAG TPA: hypothetical protein [Caudoviricetes sp.]